MKDPLLSIHNLSVSLEGEVILDDINLSLFKNEILALVGESGSGKSVDCANDYGTSSNIITH